MTKNELKYKLSNLKIPEQYIDSYFNIYIKEYPGFNVSNITREQVIHFKKILSHKTRLLKKLLNYGFYAFQYFSYLNKKEVYLTDSSDFMLLNDFLGITTNLEPNEEHHDYKKLSEKCTHIIKNIELFLLKDKIKDNLLSLLNEAWTKNDTSYYNSIGLDYLTRKFRKKTGVILKQLEKLNDSKINFEEHSIISGNKNELEIHLNIFLSTIPIHELKMFGLSNYEIDNKSLFFIKPSGQLIEQFLIKKLNFDAWAPIPSNKSLTDENIDIIATPKELEQKNWITISITNRSEKEKLSQIYNSSIYFENPDESELKIKPLANYIYNYGFYEINKSKKTKIINLPVGQFVDFNLSIFKAYQSLKNKYLWF